MSRLKLGIIAGVGTFVLFFLMAVGAGVSNRQKTDMPVSEILANLANAADEMVGDKVAHNIVVGGARIDGETRLTYIYNVTEGHHVDESIAGKQVGKLKRLVCRDRMMRAAIDGGAEIRYSYLSRTGKQMLLVEVDQMVCENL